MKYTIYLLASYLVQYILYDGLGLLFIRLFFKDIKLVPIIYRLFLGLFSLISILSILHFFFPIDSNVTYLILGIAIFSKLSFTYFQFNKTNLNRKKVFTFSILVFSSFLLTINEISKTSISPYDAGLYHFPVTKWLMEFPIIPGLGNLHSRLSFNNTWFYDVAFFKNIFSRGFIHYLLVSFWYFVLLTYFLNLLQDSLKRKRRIFLFLLFLGNILLLVYFPLFIVSISPDSISYYLSLFVLTELVLFIYERQTDYFEAFCVFIILLLLSTKVISILVVFPFSIILLRFKNLKRIIYQYGKTIIAITLIFGIIYCLRGYILSGYFSYPLSISIFDPDWKIPSITMEQEAREVRGWARHPGTGYIESLSQPFLVWFEYWLDLYKDNFIIRLLGISLSIGSFTSLFLLFSKTRRNFQTGLISIFLSIGILAWLFNAPDPRFVYGLLVFSIIFDLVIGSIFLEDVFDITKIKYILVFIVIILMFKNINFNNPDYTRIPVVPLDTRNVRNGIVFTPIDSEQCWEASLPCTPYFNPELKFRGKSIRNGFTVK